MFIGKSKTLSEILKNVTTLKGLLAFLDDQWTYYFLVGYSNVKPIIFSKFREGPSIVLI